MTYSQSNEHSIAISKAADNIEQKVIDWRHDIHEHPELGNRESRTADLIAKQLKFLRIEVQTKAGVTGVVGILKGDQLGHVVALPTDIDALPVEEKNDLPFAFKAKTNYNGKVNFVMHACVHKFKTVETLPLTEQMYPNTMMQKRIYLDGLNLSRMWIVVDFDK